jgi:HSP20 family protein
MPGLDPKDINLSISGQTLTISGERREEKDVREKAYTRIERHYGSFRRSILLPEGIDPNKVTADYENGTLTIRIPRKETAQSKRIQVSSKGSTQPKPPDKSEAA